MAKMVLCGVLAGMIVFNIINAIKKTNRLFVALSSVIELVIVSVMLTLDVISGNDVWIAWAIWVAVDVALLTRKIMKDEQTIQVLKGMVNFQQMIIVNQQLDLNNSNKANTEH